MRLRVWILGVLLLAVAASSGCGLRRSSFRRCCPQPALMPPVAVPVTAGSICCPPPCP